MRGSRSDAFALMMRLRHHAGVPMLSIVVSTIAFFVASHFLKRYLDGHDIPKGMTRAVLVFTLALAMSYGVAVIAEHLFA
jgi:VIT1/CCC1 family predicted Fe2+/Mn2+ transporter